MENHKTAGQVGIVPLMRYRDVDAAINWLNDAFGFETQFAARDDDGSIFYAQLIYGTGLVMVGSDRDSDLDNLMRLPDEIGGCETQCCYVFVDDIRSHMERAVEAGAEIVLELQGDDAAGRGYSCRDPQGHIWNFGEYHPGKAVSLDSDKPAEPSLPRRSAKWSIGAGLAAVIATIVGGGALWLNGISAEAAQNFVVSALRHGPTEVLRPKKKSGDLAVLPAQSQAVNHELELQRGARLSAERDAERVREGLGRLQKQAEKAEERARALEVKLSRVISTHNDTKRIAQVLREDLARERIRAQGAQVASKEFEDRLTAIERAKTSSERALKEIQQKLFKVQAEKDELERKFALAAPSAHQDLNRQNAPIVGQDNTSKTVETPDSPAAVEKKKTPKKAKRKYKKKKKVWKKKKKKKYKKVVKKKKAPKPQQPTPAFSSW